MKILVTGGSGFIGTCLVADLLEDGHEIVIYDIRKSKKYPEFCIVADVLDRRKLTESMVYHSFLLVF